MRGVNVTLRPDEKSALVVLAQQERRDPRDQAALIIRQELERRGLLTMDAQHADAQHADGDTRQPEGER